MGAGRRIGKHKGGAKTRIIGMGVFGKLGKKVKRKIAPKVRTLLNKTSGLLKGVEAVAKTYDGPNAEKAAKAAHDIRFSIGKARKSAAAVGKSTAERKSDSMDGSGRRRRRK
tara:strand:- start:993 stop:1328 length:336 start_codon:yes stop_codon:yes gene_type:complete